MKLTFARIAQQASGLELELLGEEGLRYSDWTMVRPDRVDLTGRDAGYRYLRAKGNSIEGGTSEILRNIVAERVLGLPGEMRVDKERPWKEPTSDHPRPALHRHRGRPARERQVAAAARCHPDAVTAMYDGDRSVVTGLWSSLAADLGLAGLLVPEAAGGAGASAREAAVVMEEFGRFVAPVPFLTSAVIATTLLRDTGLPVLDDLASGSRTAALAVPFSASPYDALPDLAVDPDGRVSGQITSVAGALEADVILVPADGGVHLVAAEAAAVAPVVSLDMSRQLADVTFDLAAAVRVDGLGEADVRCALETGAALLASEQAGVAARCLESTVDYLKIRRQFGRVVGGFQALKHRLADLYVGVEGARAAARNAVAAVAADDPDAPLATAVAQAFCSDLAVLAAEEAVQLHGGIGMTWEHPTHLYLKRAKADQIALGTAGRHRSRLALLADLPVPAARPLHLETP